MINIKKTNDILIILLCVFTSFLISYFLLDSFICSFLFSSFSLILIIHIYKKKKESNLEIENVNKMCDFINLLNSQMLNSSSLYDAYQNIENHISVDFTNMSKDDMFIQLEEIAKEYELNCFKMYINDLKQSQVSKLDYFEQVRQSTMLCLKEKENFKILKDRKYKSLIQLNYLYVMWITLLVFIKVCIADYYLLMLSEGIYKLLLFLILIIGALSYYFAYKEYLKNKYD